MRPLRATVSWITTHVTPMIPFVSCFTVIVFVLVAPPDFSRYFQVVPGTNG
jgi:hypothetical protein